MKVFVREFPYGGGMQTQVKLLFRRAASLVPLDRKLHQFSRVLQLQLFNNARAVCFNCLDAEGQLLRDMPV